ncbi:50S ribosomal protein L28 [Candidatus Berkelbacteria bacterium]|nr:50S ribosomal protein L28 [Candidatus Berkelbacteria bacterium]
MHFHHLRKPAVRYCAVCGKEPVAAYHVSHSHRRIKRTLRPNLKPAGGGYICTRCLKTTAKSTA